jgi:hypothetical protein
MPVLREVGSFVQDLAGITAVIPGISTAIEVRKQPDDISQRNCSGSEGTSRHTKH